MGKIGVHPIPGAGRLADVTVRALGLFAGATVNDAILKIMELAGIGDGIVRVTGPAGFQVNGLGDDPLVLDGEGKAVVELPAGSYTPQAPNYMDCAVAVTPDVAEVVPGQVLTVAITEVPTSGMITVTTTGDLVFSPLVASISDLTLCGGGGGGSGAEGGSGLIGSSTGDDGAGGGGGGGSKAHSITGTITVEPNMKYPVVIGPGGGPGRGGSGGSSGYAGKAGTAGGTGGTTTAFGSSASGGSGGTQRTGGPGANGGGTGSDGERHGSGGGGGYASGQTGERYGGGSVGVRGPDGASPGDGGGGGGGGQGGTKSTPSGDTGGYGGRGKSGYVSFAIVRK